MSETWNFNKSWYNIGDDEPPLDTSVYCLVEHDTMHTDDMPFVVELIRKERSKPDMGSTEKWAVPNEEDQEFLGKDLGEGCSFINNDQEWELAQPFTVVMWRYK